MPLLHVNTVSHLKVLMLVLYSALISSVTGYTAGESSNLRGSGLTQSGGGSPLEPRFLIEPNELYYVVKNRPVSLVCRVVGASKVNFRCGDKWVDPAHQVSRNGTDESSELAYMEGSVDIYREEIEAFSAISKDEPYWCECCAWGGNVHVPYKTSRRALIRIAYLRRYFEREPLSTSVEFESPVQLQCLPPQGLPYPETYWLKNNERIDASKEINYIVTSEGDLIISQARFSEQGNYTCVAENIASKRYSEPAFLTVHISGKWSEWSSWSVCPAGCGQKQSRRRTCSDPEPRNGGAECVGESEQERNCSKPCPVDGGWSEWSSWSTCGANCRRYRRRLCNNPSPAHGGRSCPDHDLDTVDCCGDSPTDDEPSTASILPYVGLALAIVLFIISLTVVLLIFMLRHRRLQKSCSKMESQVQPDITQTVVPFLPGARYSADRSHDYCPDDDVMSCQLLYQRVSEASESDTTAEVPDSYLKKDQESISHYGLRSADPIMWSSISNSGGRIDIPRSSVSLILPEGAVKTATDFFLTICREDTEKMRLSDTQTYLSPIVAWGCRCDIKLDKPVVLTFQHCAYLENGRAQDWNLQLYGCELKSANTWKLISSVDGQTSASPDQKTFVHVDKGHCHVVTSSLMRYVLIGQPKIRHTACKSIQLAAFASSFAPSSSEHSIRIYFVENTMDALESIADVETRLGSSLLCTPKAALFEYGCGNLCLVLEILDGYRWTCKRSASYQEIPFSQIWSGSQSGLHCSFTLEYDVTGYSATQSLVKPSTPLSCAVQIYQKNLPERHETLQLTLSNTQNYYQAPHALGSVLNYPTLGANFRQEHLGIV